MPACFLLSLLATAATLSLSCYSSEDDEDFNSQEGAEDDISLEEVFDKNKEVSEEEEEATMPPKKRTPAKKAASKSPVRKKAPPPAATVADVTASVKAIAVAPKSSYNMTMVCPFMMWSYTVDEREHVTVEFYCPTNINELFRPKRDPNDPSILQLLCVVPAMFPDKVRLTDTHHGVAGFNANTHKSMAYKSLVEGMEVDIE